MGNTRAGKYQTAHLKTVTASVAVLSLPSFAMAQIACNESVVHEPGVLTEVGDVGAYVEMHALLEKTIFKVDVLTLTVRLLNEEAHAAERVVAASRFTSAARDSLAHHATYAQRACAVIEFKRGVSLKQFLDGIDDNMRRARDAAIITQSDYALISEGLPRWFAFLEEGGINKGDRVLYDIRGDSLTTRYVTATGDSLLDQTDVGPERRLAVLGSYFAPKSDFRENLLDSYLRSANPERP